MYEFECFIPDSLYAGSLQQVWSPLTQSAALLVDLQLQPQHFAALLLSPSLQSSLHLLGVSGLPPETHPVKVSMRLSPCGVAIAHVTIHPLPPLRKNAGEHARGHSHM